MATMQSEVQSILTQLADLGWRIESGKGSRQGHPRCFPPNRSLPAMTVSLTPGTQRWRLHLNAELRRRGFTLEGMTVKTLASKAVASEQTEKETAPAPRKDPVMKPRPAPPRAATPAPEPEPAKPGPDDVVSIEPAPIVIKGFPGKTTDKIMLVTYGDGRTIFECTEGDCRHQADSLHKVMYHRRSHKSLRLVTADVSETEQVEQAEVFEVPLVAQGPEASAEQDRDDEAPPAATVVEGQTTTAPVVEVVPVPAPAPAVVEADVLTQASVVIAALQRLTEEVETLRRKNRVLQHEVDEARRHRDEAEAEQGEWRRRAHAAEAVVNQIRGLTTGTKPAQGAAGAA